MKLEVVEWSQEAERAIIRAAWSDGDLSAIRDEVQRGHAQLWRIDQGDAVTYLTTRVERLPNGERELVLVAGAGRDARGVVTAMLDIATQHDIRRVRAHVERRGLRRMLERLGFVTSHYVLMWVDHGRKKFVENN